MFARNASVTVNGLNIPLPSNTAITSYTFPIVTTGDTYITFSVNDGIDVLLFTNVSIVSTLGPCFHGKSKILTKNIINNEIKTINVNELLSSVHEVYSINDQKFVSVIHNIVTGPNIDFILIKKDALGENQPIEDFYITGSHPIIINSNEIEAQYIPEAISVCLDPTLVYTICVQKREPLMINGLHVLSWELDEWTEKSREQNIIWYDNGKPNIIYNLKQN